MKPHWLWHPQVSQAWITVFFMIIAYGLSVILTDIPGPLIWPIVAMAGMIGGAIGVVMSHSPPVPGRSAPHAVLEGLWFGLWMAVVNNPHEGTTAFWIQFIIAGTIFGLFHYAFTSGGKGSDHLRHWLQDTTPDPRIWRWAGLVVVLGAALTLIGTDTPWIALAMCIALLGLPRGRALKPEHDIPALRWTLLASGPILAGLAAFLLRGAT